MNLKSTFVKLVTLIQFNFSEIYHNFTVLDFPRRKAIALNDCTCVSRCFASRVKPIAAYATNTRPFLQGFCNPISTSWRTDLTSIRKAIEKASRESNGYFDWSEKILLIVTLIHEWNSIVGKSESVERYLWVKWILFFNEILLDVFDYFIGEWIMKFFGYWILLII